jgi:hypothetical protein
MSTNPPAGRFPVWTPFLRRFTDERALNLAETRTLYDQVRSQHSASWWGQHDAVERVHNFIAERIADQIDLPASKPVLAALDRCLRAVLSLETTIFSSPNIRWEHCQLSTRGTGRSASFPPSPRALSCQRRSGR